MGFGSPRLGEQGVGGLHTEAAFSEGTGAHPACKGTCAPFQITREMARAAERQTGAPAWKNTSLQPWITRQGLGAHRRGQAQAAVVTQPLSPRTAQTQRRNRNTLPST